jgi:hypothetical protein
LFVIWRKGGREEERKRHWQKTINHAQTGTICYDFHTSRVIWELFGGRLTGCRGSQFCESRRLKRKLKQHSTSKSCLRRKVANVFPPLPFKISTFPFPQRWIRNHRFMNSIEFHRLHVSLVTYFHRSWNSWEFAKAKTSSLLFFLLETSLFIPRSL